jgi:hypothetical protein
MAVILIPTPSWYMISWIRFKLVSLVFVAIRLIAADMNLTVSKIYIFSSKHSYIFRAEHM